MGGIYIHPPGQWLHALWLPHRAALRAGLAPCLWMQMSPISPSGNVQRDGMSKVTGGCCAQAAAQEPRRRCQAAVAHDIRPSLGACHSSNIILPEGVRGDIYIREHAARPARGAAG